MVTQIRKHAKGHLYIDEWIEAKKSSYEKLGGQLDVSRTTIWRWSKEQHRLDPGKIAALADALQIEPPDFYRIPPKEPERPSVDVLLKSASEEDFRTVIDLAKRLVQRTG